MNGWDQLPCPHCSTWHHPTAARMISAAARTKLQMLYLLEQYGCTGKAKGGRNDEEIVHRRRVISVYFDGGCCVLLLCIVVVSESGIIRAAPLTFENVGVIHASGFSQFLNPRGKEESQGRV
ncbi:hypothetical protein KY285_001363 [Solanum tuberosum]|nr:hypothetical protein KY285_001363 [Solanum tuberosum]